MRNTVKAVREQIRIKLLEISLDFHKMEEFEIELTPVEHKLWEAITVFVEATK